ncbi:MBL fold metallo-hydrolase [Peptostreptococcaceae bacterium AGR-M142]
MFDKKNYKKQIEFIELKKDIYACLTLKRGIGWSNAGFINKKKSVLIDTMYDKELANQLKDFVESKTSNLNFVINTHYNGDNTWGNQVFEDNIIIGHESILEDYKLENPIYFNKLKETAKNEPNKLSRQELFLAQNLEPFDFNNTKIVLPNITFKKRMTIDLEDLKCEIMHVGPAHTRGDSMVWLPDEKILFAGDIVFNKYTPIFWVGRSINNWIEKLDFIVNKLKPEIVVPGHGPICKLKEVLDLRDYLTYTLSETLTLYNDGIKDPLEICKRINVRHYLDWVQPERIYINVYNVIKELEKVKTPLDFKEIARGVDLMRAYLDEVYDR